MHGAADRVESKRITAAPTAATEEASPTPTTSLNESASGT